MRFTLPALAAAALALVGFLVMPAIALSGDATIVGFAKKTHPSKGGDDFIEFTVTKDGPAEVLVLWATSRGQLFLHSGGVRAKPNVDFAPYVGQLFFRAEDTALTFRVPITPQSTPVSIGEGRSKDFIVGLALNPLADYGGHTVEFKDGGYEYAIGQILPCYLQEFNIFGSCQ